MYESTTQVRVRYGETDQMGYLYYGNYAEYYEVGRAEAIRQLGFTYRELEEMGIMMPVVELNVKYLRPAMYDNLITIKTILKELPDGSKIRFHSELYNEDNQLLNIGITTLVFYDMKEKQKVNMPDALLQRLQPFFIK
jgi:acyl-CoA thioester hydrolase